MIQNLSVWDIHRFAVFVVWGNGSITEVTVTVAPSASSQKCWIAEFFDQMACIRLVYFKFCFTYFILFYLLEYPMGLLGLLGILRLYFFIFFFSLKKKKLRLELAPIWDAHTACRVLACNATVLTPHLFSIHLT